MSSPVLTHDQVAEQLTSNELKLLFEAVLIQYDQEFSIVSVDHSHGTQVMVRLKNGTEKKVRIP